MDKLHTLVFHRLIPAFLVFLASAYFIPRRIALFSGEALLTRRMTIVLFLAIFVLFMFLWEGFNSPYCPDEDLMNIRTLAPVGVFILLDAYQKPPLLFRVVLIIGSVLFVLTLVRRVQWVHRRRLSPVQKQRRIRRSLSHLYYIAMTTLGVIGVLYMAANIFSFVITPLHDPQPKQDGDTATIVEVVDDVTRHERENVQAWTGMDLGQRCELLEKYIDSEECLLGVPTSIRLDVKPLDKNVLGGYNHTLGSIELDKTMVEQESLEECVKVILHEMRHCYQSNLCDVYELLPTKYRALQGIGEAQFYLKEFENYQNGSVDGDEDADDAYYYQYCEIDARNYADKQIGFYFLEKEVA